MSFSASFATERIRAVGRHGSSNREEDRIKAVVGIRNRVRLRPTHVRSRPPDGLRRLARNLFAAYSKGMVPPLRVDRDAVASDPPRNRSGVRRRSDPRSRPYARLPTASHVLDGGPFGRKTDRGRAERLAVEGKRCPLGQRSCPSGSHRRRGHCRHRHRSGIVLPRIRLDRIFGRRLDREEWIRVVENVPRRSSLCEPQKTDSAPRAARIVQARHLPNSLEPALTASRLTYLSRPITAYEVGSSLHSAPFPRSWLHVKLRECVSGASPLE